MRIFGIDPGSERTGYGCIDSDGTHHQLVACGVLMSPSKTIFPEKLLTIHDGLVDLIAQYQPECVVVEQLFYSRNVKSALKLGHVRGVVVLAATEAGLPVQEYTPTEIKQAVVGYGRAEKHQVQDMVKLLLNLNEVPTPHDVADALAAAICHLHMSSSAIGSKMRSVPKQSWRAYRPASIKR